MLQKVKSRDATQSNAATGPSTVTTKHPGHLPLSIKVSRRISHGKLFTSSPVTNRGKDIENPQKDWTADYLKDLRSNRPVRPSGSRPLPNRNATVPFVPELELPPRTSSALARPIHTADHADLTDMTSPPRSSSAISHTRARSTLFGPAPEASAAGRPLVKGPHSSMKARDSSVSTTMSINPSNGTYWERGQRWIEKQEAHSLREALEDMDSREEKRLHAAAQDEASDLVWKHQNPGAPYKSPEVTYNYRQHLLKGAHARSQSSGPYPSMGVSSPLKIESHRSTSGGSSSQETHSRVSSQRSRVVSGASAKQKVHKVDEPAKPAEKGHALWDSPHKKAYMNLRFSVPSALSSNRRRSSGQKSRNVSADNGKGLFRNPEDQIYEEPGEATSGPKDNQRAMNTAPLHSKSRNPSTKVHFAHDPTELAMTAPHAETAKVSKYDIHKNPPSRSRDPSYVSNALPPTPPESASTSDSDLSTTANKPLMKNGIEIRGEDIRAATSMRLKDRSPKLPTPTVVSDRPGRPIVSFDRDWKPKEVVDSKPRVSQGQRRVSRDSLNKALPGIPSKPRFLESTASAPVVPTLNLPEPPEIQITISSDEPIPSINVSDDIPSISEPPIPVINIPEHHQPSRPLPTPRPNAAKGRPLPHHSSTAPVKTIKSHWSPLFARRPTAQCAQCALPISGRIVSAAGQRFHPECFVCYHCSEALECVAFYPEPDTKREERVARIRARAGGEFIEEKEGMGEMEDGDEGLRFYCHLDFHEFFSPRCRSCKTPIEGEVVVACGGEWHVGHFFCAECGDPFDSSTPFVEKDGYAWCINCHTNRYSTKCRKCRRPVTDMVVKALGAEWHANCFCCVECNAQFEDGRYFLRGDSQDPVCVKCEERRLKA
ncbi:hypothetical protein MMC16_004385 [Acarospora aff. strigata]|nr:hypothetical protein [Acarospora aff. strigata]